MRHLLRTRDLTRDEAIHILDIALDMAAVQNREVKKLPTLRGKTVVNLFFGDSTRTRISFEAAAKRLSADVINFSARGSSISKGEPLKDTAQTLQALGADGVVIRHPVSGAPQVLAGSGGFTGSRARRGAGHHCGGHPALAGGAIQRVVAHGPWCPRSSRRAADAAAGGHIRVAGDNRV